MKIKSALTILATTLMLAGVALVSPAVAGTGSDCPNSTTCLYDYYNFDGPLGYRAAGMPRTAISSTNSDKMASWINKMPTDAAWYPATSGGACYTMAKNSTDSALAIGWRDTASVWKTTGGC